MIDNIDHVAEALSKESDIYKGAISVNNFMRPFLDEYNRIEADFQYTLSGINIDTAEQEQLDVLGQIIGLKRPVVKAGTEGIIFGWGSNLNVNPVPPFPLATSGGWGVGEWINPKVVNGGSAPLSDARYKQLLYAKIRINYFNGSVDSVLTAIQDLCDGEPNILLDESTPLVAKFTVLKQFTAFELLVFAGSYVGGQSFDTDAPIRTIFNSFIYPKTLGVWYEIDDVNSVEFAYTNTAGDPVPPVGKNKEGIDFIETGGFGGTGDGESGGEYWSGLL
jgi:hypothetical protein